MNHSIIILFLLACFSVSEPLWAQQSGGRALHGHAATRARIAGISLQQWQKNTDTRVKQSITKIIGNWPVDELNGFQKRRLTNYQRRLANRLPDFDGQIDLGTYYPTDEGAPIRYRPSNTGKIYKPKQMVRILKVMPDTSIKYDKGEKIVLINLGPANLDLTGWQIEDKTDPGQRQNKPLDLSNYKFSGRTLTIDITASQVRMNNLGGEELKLYDKSGYLQDSFSYNQSQVIMDRWITRSKNTIMTLN